jgi:hypothetical protein
MATANLRVIAVHFTEGIGFLGGQQSMGLNAMQPGKQSASSIRRIQGGYLIAFMKRLWFVPDSKVTCAEVEDLDAQEADRGPNLAIGLGEPHPAVPAQTHAPRLSDYEIAAQAALEDRKRLAHERAEAAVRARAADEAAERTRAKPGAAEALERARKEQGR